MKRKTQKQLHKELMDHLISKKLNLQETRAVTRATFEKYIYEKTKKLH